MAANPNNKQTKDASPYPLSDSDIYSANKSHGHETQQTQTQTSDYSSSKPNPSMLHLFNDDNHHEGMNANIPCTDEV